MVTGQVAGGRSLEMLRGVSHVPCEGLWPMPPEDWSYLRDHGDLKLHPKPRRETILDEALKTSQHPDARFIQNVHVCEPTLLSTACEMANGALSIEDIEDSRSW